MDSQEFGRLGNTTVTYQAEGTERDLDLLHLTSDTRLSGTKGIAPFKQSDTLNPPRTPYLVLRGRNLSD
jgi:phage I-like protein